MKKSTRTPQAQVGFTATLTVALALASSSLCAEQMPGYLATKDPTQTSTSPPPEVLHEISLLTPSVIATLPELSQQQHSEFELKKAQTLRESPFTNWRCSYSAATRHKFTQTKMAAEQRWITHGINHHPIFAR